MNKIIKKISENILTKYFLQKKYFYIFYIENYT